jgi:DNA-binding transcriptional regulator YbjK
VTRTAGDLPVRRPRRHEPERRERLLMTTLDVLAEVGVAGASLRAIARAADVPLGSLTYHFGSQEELLIAAFTRYVETMAARFDEVMRAATDPADAVARLTEHLVADLGRPSRDLVVAVELYGAAARRPGLRAVTEDWMARSRRSLERHFDPTRARQLDALVEGLLLHRALSTDPMDREQIRAALERVAA